MREYFKKEINLKKALRKHKCETFLNKFKSKFEGVGWLRIKTFIFNECKK